MQILNAFILLLAFAATAQADIHYMLNAQGRSHPGSTNLTGTVAYDGILWGESSKENPLYGYYRIGAIAGGAPSYGAFLQIAPIAPLIFEVQRGYTHRFSKIATLNCDVIECKGMVTRTDFTMRAVAAVNQFVFMGHATWRELQTPDVSTPVGLEFEIFEVPPGYHRYLETSFIIAHMLPENQAVGVMINNGGVAGQNLKNSSAYGVYRFPWNEFNFSVGAGAYTSSAPNQDGFSAFLSITRNWGEKLSLF